MIDHAERLADVRLQAHAERLRGGVPPSAVRFVPQLAGSIPWRTLGDPASPGWSDRLLQAVTAKIRTQVGMPGGLADADVMALAFLVLMQAARSAREDLKAIMDGVKAANRAKEELRGLLLRLQERTERAAVVKPGWPPR